MREGGAAMPLGASISSVHSDVSDEVQASIGQVFRLLDAEIAQLADEKNLATAQVRLLRPSSICVLVSDQELFVVATNINVGGMANHWYLDWTGKEMNLPTAVYLAERDLAFEQAFGFSFSRGVLNENEDDQREAARHIAEDYIDDEIINLERLNRIVRMNPLFQGRDFLLNDQLSFVLSPFGDPFDTIYSDHIKPTVERNHSMRCLRADDIYDNRAIIEDIWQKINEARIIISELTGRNPNVFYETGIAHTVGKEVILITQSMEDVPFDLRHLRCIVYEYTPRGVQLLEENLTNTITNILHRA